MRLSSQRGLPDRILGLLSKVSAQKPWPVIVIGLLLGLAAWLAMVSMPVDATFLGIVDEDDPDARHFRDISKAFGGSGNLLLLVEGRDAEQCQAFLRELGPALKPLDQWIKGLDIQIGLTGELDPALVPLPKPALDAVTELLQSKPDLSRSLLAAPDLTKLARLLEARLDSLAATPGSNINEQAAALERAMTVLARLISANEPASLQDFAQLFAAETSPRWESRFVKDGWVKSADGRCFLATLRLRIDILDTALGVDFFGDIESTTDALARKFPGLRYGYAGAPAYGYEDQQSVLSRTRLLSFLSLVLVLALFFLVDRSLLAPFIVGLPLLLGTVWTFGLVKIFIGYISLTSAVFGILLFGLGIDFAIHIVVRYNDARAAGRSHEDALDDSLVLTGRGVVTGGLTTAAAFFGMLVNDTKAASHLGITTGFGLLCCLIAMLTVLPALLTVTLPFKSAAQQRTNMDLPWLDALVGFVIRRPIAVLIGVTALSILGLALGSQARIEYDIEKIATRGAKAIQVKAEIQSRFELATDFALCVCDELEQARALVERLRARRLKSIARVESITDLLSGDPEAGKAQLASLKTLLEEPGASQPEPRTSEELARSLARPLLKLRGVLGLSQSLKPEPALAECIVAVDKVLTLLRAPESVSVGLQGLQRVTSESFSKFASALRCEAPRPLVLSDLPETVREKFVDSRGRYVVLVFPTESMLDADRIMGFFRDLEADAPGVTGIGKIVNLFIRKSLANLPRVLIFVSAIVLLVVGLDFKSARLAILVFLPLIYAMGFALGAVVLSGQVVSVLMLAGFPLVLGIGVDDGVHLVHRVLEDPRRGVVAAVADTGKAILLTSVTTMVSFGGLLLMNHHGLEGLGFLVCVGVGFCFLCSVTVFPAFLVLVYPHLPGMQELSLSSDGAGYSVGSAPGVVGGAREQGSDSEKEPGDSVAQDS